MKQKNRHSLMCVPLLRRKPMPSGDTSLPQPDVTYKVIVLGESGVGKTSLLNVLVDRGFQLKTLPTCGIDFVKKVYPVEAAHVRLQIWDTAGQERFHSITRMQYRNAKGIVLVYDITSQRSFDRLSQWYASIDKDLVELPDVPVFVVANKSDSDEMRQVKAKDAETFSFNKCCSGFFETSAATGAGVDEMFSTLARRITEINHPELVYVIPPKKEVEYLDIPRPDESEKTVDLRQARKKKHCCRAH